MRVVEHSDHTFETLQKGFNLRWPPDSNSGANRIYICATPEEVMEAANDALSKDYRITVRSGGHCYEGLVANKIGTENLAIIDLSELKGFQYDDDMNVVSPWEDIKSKYRFKIFTGNQNWEGYVSLYKRSGKTLPGGSCYSVGIGGHISGGGYGLLSRMHGLTVDWVTGVDVMVPSSTGKSLQARHVRADSTNKVDQLLFKACCGAGGGNFGIIIAYYFDNLPDAPTNAYWIPLAYPWHVLKPRFTHFLKTYWKWFSDNDKEASDNRVGVGNGGLFTLLKLNHVDASENVILAIQYTGPTGLVGGDNDIPLNDFIAKMNEAAGFTPMIHEEFILPNVGPLKKSYQKKSVNKADIHMSMDWFYLTQMINGSGSNQRGKYKSEYQIEQFSDDVCNALLKHLTTGTPDKRFNQTLVQIDSYGGVINKNGIGSTAVPQRKSLLKTQYQTYWSEKENDSEHIQWIRGVYNDVHNGKPSLPAYEGCYINYPDIDIKYNENGELDPEWLNYYYGWNQTLIEELLLLKTAIDPRNIFHHELSIPSSSSEFPDWSLGRHYMKFSLVKHNAEIWQCNYSHDSLSPQWAPGIAISLWEKM